MSRVNEVTMPQLGETVAEGTVTRWLKQVGETVAEGEALLEISTDKVDTEIPAPTAGTVLEILVGEDATVPVGSLLARIGEAAAPALVPDAALVPPTSAPVAAAAPPAAAMSMPITTPTPTPTPNSVVVGGQHRHAFSPRMRRLAESTGVDLGSVKGSGPGGRLVDADVLGAAAPTVPTPVTVPVAQQAPIVPTTPTVSTTPAVSPAPTVPTPAVPGAVTVLLEIDVTHLRSVPDPDTALLAAVAAKAIPALRHSGAVGTAAAPDLEVNGQVIARGGDLTVRALRQRIAEPAGSSADSSAQSSAGSPGAADRASGTRVTVHGTPMSAATVQIPALAPDSLCAVGVGGVRQGAVVIADGLHGPVLAIGALATLAVSYDPVVLPQATAAAYISTLSQRLADRALAGELSD